MFQEESPEKLKAGIDMISVPVFVADLQADGDFKIVAINAAHSRITGISSVAAAGKTPLDLLCRQEEADAVMKHYRDCLEMNQPSSYREVLTLDGTQMTFDTTLHPVMRNGDTPDRVIGTAVRVLTRGRRSSDNAFFLAQLRGSLTTMEQLFDQASDALSMHETAAIEILLRSALSSLAQIQTSGADQALGDVSGGTGGLAKSKAAILLN